MTQTILARFRFRHGTAAEWTASNEVLLADEGGHEADTNKLKIGDGVTAWSALPYFGGSGGAGISYVIGGGSGDAITAAFVPALATLTEGLTLSVRAPGANTGTTPTLNPNGLGALLIKKFGGNAMIAGDISGAGHELLLQYSTLGGAHYELINPTPAPGGVTSIVAGSPNVTIDATNIHAPVLSVGSIALKGRVATYAALPSSGNANGDSYLVDADSLTYIWNGSAWPASGAGLIIGIAPFSGWTDATSILMNGWIAYGGSYAPPAYYKDAMGRVHLRGLLKGGTVSAAALTMPEGFRTSSSGWLSFATMAPISGGGIQVDVLPNGQIWFQGGANYYRGLDGISYQAEA